MLRICIIYGGNSVEHEISIISANSILNNLDQKKYKIIGIYITKSGSFREARISKSGLSHKFVFSVNFLQLWHLLQGISAPKTTNLFFFNSPEIS